MHIVTHKNCKRQVAAFSRFECNTRKKHERKTGIKNKWTTQQVNNDTISLSPQVMESDSSVGFFVLFIMYFLFVGSSFLH